MPNNQDSKDNETKNDYVMKYNEDVLLNLYHEFNANRIDYNKMKWDTARFYTSLNAALITATVALLTFKYDSVNLSTNAKFILPLSVLPASVVIISLIGLVSAERESKRLFEQEASMFKIEKCLGLHEKIPEKLCWLKGDPYLVPPKNRDIYHRTYNLNKNSDIITLDDWVKARMMKHKFRYAMLGIYLVEICVSIALLVVLLTSYS